MLILCTRMSLIRHSYVTPMCWYFILCAAMYWYAIYMSLVCTGMSSVCHSYVLVCNGMSLICTCTSFVCHSYVVYVTVCHSYVLVCHPYVSRMQFYHELIQIDIFKILNFKRLFVFLLQRLSQHQYFTLVQVQLADNVSNT